MAVGRDPNSVSVVKRDNVYRRAFTRIVFFCNRVIQLPRAEIEFRDAGIIPDCVCMTDKTVKNIARTENIDAILFSAEEAR